MGKICCFSIDILGVFMKFSDKITLARLEFQMQVQH